MHKSLPKLNLLFLSMFVSISSLVQAQIITGGAAIQSSFVEVGVSDAGTFGVPIANLPANYHSRSNQRLFGFVADPGSDGWGPGPFMQTNTGSGTDDMCGDYFTPGSPEETWGISVGEFTHYHNANTIPPGGAFSIPGSITNYTGTPGGGGTIEWDGMITNGAGSGLAVNQIVSVQEGELFFSVKVCITNTTSNPIEEVYYMRNFDPDNDVMVNGNFDTRNTINQQNNGPGESSVVSAIGSRILDADPTNDDEACYLAMISQDCRARVGWGGFSNRRAYRAYNNGFGSLIEGATRDADEAIYTSFNLGTLAAGESVTFTYAYVLNLGDLERALSLITPFTASIDGAIVSNNAQITLCTDDTASLVEIEACGYEEWVWPSKSNNVEVVGSGGTQARLIPCQVGTELIPVAGVGVCGNDTFWIELNVESCHEATEQPNCIEGLDVAIGNDDFARFRLSEIVSNDDFEATLPLTISIENGFGGIIHSGTYACDAEICLDGCSLFNERHKINVENSLGSCWSYLTAKRGNDRLISNLDTAVWCSSELLTWDANDLENINWYTTSYPYTLLPVVDVFCGTDKILETLTDINGDGRVNEYDARSWYLPKFEACEYKASDWVDVKDCGDSDTTKMITRNWSAIDSKTGERISTSDVIVVYKLPRLTADNFYVPQKDTVSCFLDTIYNREISKVGFNYWKQIVGLHTDGSYVFYPQDQINDAINLVSNATSEENASLLRAQLSALPLVIKEGSNEEIDVFDISSTWPTTTIDGKVNYFNRIELGDRFLSNNGNYINATTEWFYEPGAHGFWIDLAIPYAEINECYEVCDQWEDWTCETGIRLLLPNNPFDASLCVETCLTKEVLTESKCFAVLHSEIKDLGGSCPRVEKKYYEIKQLCYGDSIKCSSPVYYRNEAGQIVDSLISDPSGIVRITETAGTNTIVIEQWKSYIDTVAPLFNFSDCNPPYQLDAKFIWSTESHDCNAEVKVPAIYLKDDCSGVKYAKASVYPRGAQADPNTYGWRNLDRGESGDWIHETGRAFSLPCGYYSVYYEFSDSCHNVTSASAFIIHVVDNQFPTVITNDNINVSLGQKTVWIDAKTFDRGSMDNCGIRMMLARRTDWKSACGVELCSDALSGITSESELDAFIAGNGITATLNDTEIERFYAEQYQWLRDDNQWCFDDYEDEYKYNYIIEGWRQEIRNYWVESCGLVDDHGNPIIDTDGSPQGIGGGWSQKVPFCCDDACKEVIVELLVVDKDCNYTKGWVVIEPEDKSTIEKFCEFDEINITCSSFAANYKELVDAALAAGENSAAAPEEYAAVDEQLGSLMKGWRSNTNQLVDEEGIALEKKFSYLTTVCEDSIILTQLSDTLHDGTIDWVNVYDTVVILRDVEKEATKGGAVVLCSSNCIQDIWVDLNSCGVGTIKRRWTVSSGCADSHNSTPIIYEQVINISASCELSKNMFVLEDARDELCESLDYTTDGNVDADAGTFVYTLSDLACRNLGISHRDEVLKIVGTENLYKVHRTWTATDWCSGDNIVCLQKFIVNTDCANGASLRGRVVKQDSDVGVSGVLIMDPNSTKQTFSDASGGFEIQGVTGLNLSKSGSASEGLDIRDLVMIHSYVQGKRNLTALQKMSADVNNDGEINNTDASIIRDVLLGRLQEYPNNKIWSFYYDQTMEENYKWDGSTSKVQFIGIKTGDIDNQSLSLSRSADIATIDIDESNPIGEQSDLLILNLDEGIDVYQFSLQLDVDKAELVNVNGDRGELSWTSDDEGNINLVGDAKTIRIELRSKTAIESHDLISINGKDDWVDLALKFGKTVKLELNSTLPTVEGAFEMYQNVPNPVTDQTTEISFSLPKSELTALNIFDVSGRVVYSDTRVFEAGRQSFIIDTSEFETTNTSGVFFYQIKTETYSSTKQMIIIR